ncbi:MAG: efflux RND transporter permease subunit [Desulfobacteraceae bacterium]|nr:efflux RND transporter permease subunit [Desulfobacteraceae bacterium]
MNITKTAIEKNRITLVLLFILLTGGVLSYFNMPKAEDPGFTVRGATVTTIFPGASPERMENLITDRIEKLIQEMPELDVVESESRTGFSLVKVHMKQSYKEMRPIWDDLRRKVEKAELPDGAIGPMVNDDYGDVFGTIVTITGDGYSYAELKDAADDIRDELLKIDDVAEVELHGVQEEHVFIDYNNSRMAKLGISPYLLMQMLAAQNIINPGGNINTGMERIVLEPSGDYESVDEIKQTILRLPGRKDLIILSDIADVYRGYVDPVDSVVTSSGQQAIALAISMRDEGNIITLGNDVKALITDLQAVYPHGLELDFVAFQKKFVEEKVKGFTRNLMQSVCIVLAVMLLALGLRTGFIVSSLIPCAMIISLFVMDYFKIGLDQMSLAALIISLGMLVDNAIVMSESIMVQIQEGKSTKQAAIDSATELKIPLLTSSLTTAAAFLPIYLAESDAGEYTAPLFKVVSITLLCSWILSITVIPLFCARFMRVKKQASVNYNTSFYRFYRWVLIHVLRHKFVTIALVVVMFAMVMQGAKFIPKRFFPDNDKPVFTAVLELPYGTAIEETIKMSRAMDTYIQENLAITENQVSGITNWSTYTGTGAPRFVLNLDPEPKNSGLCYMLINATDFNAMHDSIKKLERYALETFPDVKPDIGALALGPPSDAPLGFRITGKDVKKLSEIIEQIKIKLSEHPDVKFVFDDWGRLTKKINVDIDNARALRAGVTHQDIALSLQTILSGFDITEYREDDKVIPITLRSVAADRQDIGKLESLNIYSMNTGKTVPLSQVADLNVEYQPSVILRRDRTRTMTVNALLTEEGNAVAIYSWLKPWLDEQQEKWGIGYGYEVGGEIEESIKSNAAIGDKLGISLMIIVLLLVIQFNSIRKPLIILMTIPLGLIGVVTGLLLGKSYFGFMTFLGVISLAGIVVNNAIVLLERIQLELDEFKRTQQDAIIEAVQRRLRPILLTTLTTVGGLLPLWLFSSPMWPPMAIAIIFGLIFATVLTLGVVPILYAIFYRVSFKGYLYQS